MAGDEQRVLHLQRVAYGDAFAQQADVRAGAVRLQFEIARLFHVAVAGEDVAVGVDAKEGERRMAAHLGEIVFVGRRAADLAASLALVLLRGQRLELVTALEQVGVAVVGEVGLGAELLVAKGADAALAVLLDVQELENLRAADEGLAFFSPALLGLFRAQDLTGGDRYWCGGRYG
jgi:hypothetical protein